MGEYIRHEGIVASVDGDLVRVRVAGQAACGGCEARGLCARGGGKTRYLDVRENGAEKRYKVGDKVRVCGARGMTRSALWWAFGAPLSLALAWLAVGRVWLCLCDLWLSAGVLVGGIVYVALLWANKKRMARKFAFWLERVIE